MIGHYIEPFILLLDGYLQRPELSGAEALDGYFQELIAELERRQFKGGCLIGNLSGEIGDTSELCRQALKTALGRYRDKLAEGIARGQAQGRFRTDLPAAAMADFLADAWQGALLRMKIEQSVQPCGIAAGICCRAISGPPKTVRLPPLTGGTAAMPKYLIERTIPAQASWTPRSCRPFRRNPAACCKGWDRLSSGCKATSPTTRCTASTSRPTRS